MTRNWVTREVPSDACREAKGQRPADRLIALEEEDRKLSARMHKDQRRREEIQREARALRISFTHEDHRTYEALRLQ